MKLEYIIIRPKHFSSNEGACEQLFCREKRRVLFGRVIEMGASLGEVLVRVELQGDNVEKLKKFLKKCLVSLLGRKLFRPPSYMNQCSSCLCTATVKLCDYLLVLKKFVGGRKLCIICYVVIWLMANWDNLKKVFMEKWNIIKIFL